MNRIGRTIGFLGGGRVTGILLGGLARQTGGVGSVVVAEPDATAREKLSARFPSIVAVEDVVAAVRQEVVFVALHPPVMRKALPTLAGAIAPASTVVSLAPVVGLAELSRLLGGHERVARMIPNAPSMIGEGWNPMAFGPGVPEEDREALHGLFAWLGSAPEVPEAKLEAYAVVTAMGPTYLWFQMEELLTLATSFGLGEEEARAGLAATLHGATRLLLESGLSAAEVEDTIPVKPLAEEADAIREAYRRRLVPLHAKLTGRTVS